ncbi:hypothetical protein [Kibdelosporangium phytohabitans]|uniref:DUF4878 domain-containing protein n=1 Tax=Kibdelosporangium phytohabitans TaxID=860235 RepID=A0A0N9I3S4_9PSEU|nr:hypothetical protein [Kibdelosporangium phytohabitans]ALG08950.1 hypothetical protein AOZ06_20355 [Kibdelosporangium phytohabitans]MBE1469879.1 hypothetical protein [Kibdelosporangium phytohabitans]
MTAKRPRAAKLGPLGSENDEKTKRRNGVILVVASAVLVVAAAAGGILMLTGGSPEDDATSAAREFAQLYQRGLNSSGRDVDASAFEPVVCGQIMPQLREAFSAKENPVPGTPQFVLAVKDVKTNGDRGSFTLATKVTAPGTPEQSDDAAFDLVKEDGHWRVCSL